MVTKLCSRKEMLYKNQRGIIQKRNKIALRFLCTALQVIARNMHTKYGPFEPIVTKLCSGQEMLYKKRGE